MFHNCLAGAWNRHHHETSRSWIFKKCNCYNKVKKTVAWGSIIKFKKQFVFQQNKIAIGCLRKVGENKSKRYRIHNLKIFETWTGDELDFKRIYYEKWKLIIWKKRKSNPLFTASNGWTVKRFQR